jgi:uncharacterized protein Yka (UPF0111/DUF47 family)
MLGVSTPTVPMRKLAKILVDCTHRLDIVVPKLRRHEYAEIVAVARELRQIEKDADTVYREAISALFHDPAVDAKQLIREKAVLEDLENAVDQCDSIGDFLANLAVKNG